MAEDAGSEGERKRLLAMAEQLREGEPLSSVLAESGTFPDYVIQTARLGETTGSMDICMESLAAHYEQEYYLSENVRRAITYPAMMVVMLLVILFVLFSRVMPVFTGVYESLGASIPAAAAAAMEFGTIFSGAAPRPGGSGGGGDDLRRPCPAAWGHSPPGSAPSTGPLKTAPPWPGPRPCAGSAPPSL